MRRDATRVVFVGGISTENVKRLSPRPSGLVDGCAAVVTVVVVGVVVCGGWGRIT